MIDKLKAALVSLFGSLKSPEGDAIVDVLSRWGLDFGFDRTGNSTAWKPTIGRGEAQSRVSLDTYTDGTPCIVINRMLATSWRQVFASALHGAILAWRKDAGAKDDKGRERLIDAAFTAMASKVGLSKVAEETEHNGKTVKVGDTMRRAWYGLSAHLETLADSLAESAGPLPLAYAGTDERNSIGTLLLPADALIGDERVSVFVRISSFTAGEKAVAEGTEKENPALVSFRKVTAIKGLIFNEKNKGFRLLKAKLAESTPVPEPPKVAEPVKPIPPPHKSGRKPQPQATA